MELRDLLIAVALFSSSTLAEQQCFFPDGTPSPDKPCNTGSGPSACCGTQSDGTPAWCMANGLCFGDLKISRGSCTDKKWDSQVCASECKDNSPHTGWQLFSCPQSDIFSCTDCSQSNSSVFPVPASSLRLSPAQVSSLGIPLPTATVTSSPSAAQSQSNDTPSPNCDGSSGGMSATMVGAIVGAVIGFVMLLFAGLFGWEKHKNRRLVARLRSAENWYKGWSPNDARTVAGIGSEYSSSGLRMPPPPPPPRPPAASADIKEYGPGDHTSYSRREFFARDAKVPVPRHARHEMDGGAIVAQELHSPNEDGSAGKPE